MMIIESIAMLLYSIPMQLAPPIGAVHPIVPNMINAAFLITGIAIALQFFYAFLRRKMTDLGKMRRIMKEVSEWRKEYMAAMKKKDTERVDKLKRRQQYVNKMQMEMMQMNFKPMIAFMIPMLIIWWAVLPEVFGNTVAVSPMSLNLLGDMLPLTCTKKMIIEDVNSITDELETQVNELSPTNPGIPGAQVLALANEAKELTDDGMYIDAKQKILQAYAMLNSNLQEPVQERVPRCTAENELFLWAWYAIASIAFSGMVMKLTKTSMEMGI